MKTRKTVNIEPAAPGMEQSDSRDTMGRPATPRKAEVRIGREAQVRIGQLLRETYNEVVNQGVPEHLADLVRRLSEQENGSA